MTKVLESRLGEVAALCGGFGVRRLEVFGSAAGADFDEVSSDIGFLVDFGPQAEANLFQRYFALNQALSDVLGRKVDLVMVGALHNRYFIDSVNKTRRLVYASPVTEAA